MTEVARLSVPLMAVQRPHKGAALAVTEGQVNGWPFDVVITASELHFTFADRNGPRFAVDLNMLAKEATNGIEVALLGNRRDGI